MTNALDRWREHHPATLTQLLLGEQFRADQTASVHRTAKGSARQCIPQHPQRTPGLRTRHRVHLTLRRHGRHLPRETDLNVIRSVAATLAATALSSVMLLTRSDLRALRLSFTCPDDPELAALWRAPDRTLAWDAAETLITALAAQGTRRCVELLRGVQVPVPRGQSNLRSHPAPDWWFLAFPGAVTPAHIDRRRGLLVIRAQVKYARNPKKLREIISVLAQRPASNAAAQTQWLRELLTFQA